MEEWEKVNGINGNWQRMRSSYAAGANNSSFNNWVVPQWTDNVSAPPGVITVTGGILGDVNWQWQFQPFGPPLPLQDVPQREEEQQQPSVSWKRERLQRDVEF